ncbi:MAG: hypothetical protein ACYDFQ_12035, partial [Vulcanimicrobiaceae bacterium]
RHFHAFVGDERAVIELTMDGHVALVRLWENWRSTPRAVAAEHRATDDMLAIKLATGVELLMPRKLFQGLGSADSQEVANVEIDDFGNRRWMSELGKIGGRSRSDAKTRAVRKNGRKGGRPRKQAAA